jgi:GT2 family glycosyltransferase
MADAPAEVVIVDGSPGHETERAVRDVCSTRALPFELVYVRSPKGLTRQRNVGIDISTKSFVFFLDDDALPENGYFYEMRQVFDDATIGAAGAPALNEIDKAIPRRWQLRRALRLVPRTAPFIYNDAGTSAPTGLLKAFSGIRDVDLFPGYAFAVRRSIFDSMRFSGFFEGYSLGEDVEMALRIRRQWRVVSCGSARVEHHSSPAGRPPAYAKGRMEVQNRYFIWRRYSRNANFLNRLRFHLDFGFLFLMDMLWFATRPSKTHHLSHAMGLLAGVVSCSVAPPEWDEPHPQAHFRLEQVDPIHNDRERGQ